MNKKKDGNWAIEDLKCTSPGSIYLLLKSSTIMINDYKTLKSEKPILILKKYYDFNKSMLFRVFIKNKTVIGISQRYNDQFFPFLVEMKQEIVENIEKFYKILQLIEFEDTCIKNIAIFSYHGCLHESCK